MVCWRGIGRRRTGSTLDSIFAQQKIVKISDRGQAPGDRSRGQPLGVQTIEVELHCVDVGFRIITAKSSEMAEIAAVCIERIEGKTLLQPAKGQKRVHRSIQNAGRDCAGLALEFGRTSFHWSQ